MFLMICYHGLPMWPLAAMARAFPGRHACVSYARPEQIEIACEICPSVIGDSGTFSAWIKGDPPDFDGFHTWLTIWLKHPAFAWYFIPDIIDGSEADNNRLIAEWDLPRGVPVYHMHESTERLEWLVSSYERVAIGSSGEYAEIGTRAWWNRMAELMAVACDENGHPRTQLHGLRQLDTTVTSHVPYSSGDSSTAAQALPYDARWIGPYEPASKEVKAIVVMDRIERHATARRWCKQSSGVQKNMELLG